MVSSSKSSGGTPPRSASCEGDGGTPRLLALRGGERITIDAPTPERSTSKRSLRAPLRENGLEGRASSYKVSRSPSMGNLGSEMCDQLGSSAGRQAGNYPGPTATARARAQLPASETRSIGPHSHGHTHERATELRVRNHSANKEQSIKKVQHTGAVGLKHALVTEHRPATERRPVQQESIVRFDTLRTETARPVKVSLQFSKAVQ